MRSTCEGTGGTYDDWEGMAAIFEIVTSDFSKVQNIELINRFDFM